MNILSFIIGFILGGIIMMVIMCLIQINRINSMEKELLKIRNNK